MFRDVTIIIGLVFVGFMMGVLFHVKNPDYAIQRLTPITKAGATMHQYRHTPYAIPKLERPPRLRAKSGLTLRPSAKSEASGRFSFRPSEF